MLKQLPHALNVILNDLDYSILIVVYVSVRKNILFRGGFFLGTAVVWFRGLLRLHDNPVLSWASSSDEIDSVIPVT